MPDTAPLAVLPGASTALVLALGASAADVARDVDVSLVATAVCASGAIARSDHGARFARAVQPRPSCRRRANMTIWPMSVSPHDHRLVA